MADELSELILERDGEVLLNCFIQVRASRNAIVGRHGDELKVALTAPPVDGKANALLIEFFAKLLGVGKSRICLRSGLTSRHKQLSFERIGREEMMQALSR